MKITVMCKSTLFNRTIASVLFLFFLVLGCEEATQPPVKPVVIKKRISEQSSPPESEKQMQPAETQKMEPPPASSENAVPASDPSPSPKPLASTAPAVKADEAAVEEKSTVVDVPETALTEKLADSTPRYDPTGKIDPFAPIFKDTPPVEEESVEKKIVRRRPLTPLEKIDLSQLKLVGVIRAESGNRAMVEDATGKGYVITKGSYVGIYGGRVVQIERDRAFIEEEVEDIFGKISATRKELKLQKPPGEE
ncbi:MAG: pilus assembly protein PilP [Pseudomonadota bacterium]